MRTGIDGFEQREEQLVAVLHGLAGTDTDVKVVFRQQVLAAKVRCFFCVLTGGRIACVEVRCPHPLAVRAWDEGGRRLAKCACWQSSASAADRVFLDCRGADIPVRRACRTGPVALAVRLIVGYGAGVSGSPGQDALMLQELEDGSWMAGLPTRCLETGVIWADGRVPARESSSRPGFGRWSGPGTPRRRPPVRSRSPGRSKVRLPSLSAPCTAVTLSDTGRHGERAHCRLIRSVRPVRIFCHPHAACRT